MAKPANPGPRSRRVRPLRDVDLRLLRIFTEIVRCNGFSAAQASLGMSQSTISAHIRHLEERLDLRLCERGRSGFLLTEEGKKVHSAVLDLFGSIDHFQSSIGDIQGELTGRLTFGTVDAMVSNRALDLDSAFGRFRHEAPLVELDIDIAAPQALAQGLLSGRYQVVLMPAQKQVSRMHARTLFSETQKLYCGRAHPLFGVEDRLLGDGLLAEQAFAGRSYMQQATICGVRFNWSATTAHMEGTLLLLLSGAYIGFLPDHYAAEWVDKGLLRALQPARMTFEDAFQIVYSHERPTRAAELLVSFIGTPPEAARGRGAG